MRFLARRIRAAGRLMGRALCSPRSKPAVPANFPAVPPAAAIFRQHLELATILAGGAAADTARLAKSAVFAAVTSKSGRPDQAVGAPIGRSLRFANGLVSQPAGPLVLLLLFRRSFLRERNRLVAERLQIGENVGIL